MQPTRILPAALLLATWLVAPTLAAPQLEIRFYPAGELRLQPLDARRGVSSGVLQNAAVINRDDVAVTLDSLSLDLLDGESLVQSNPLAGTSLAALAARSGRLAASGMIDLLTFQFRPDLLLAGARVGGSTTLQPGEALFLGHRVVTFQGAADRLRLTAHGRLDSDSSVEAHADLPLRAGGSRNVYGFPLAGDWYIGAGPSLHSHHRWVVGEEFALDIGRLGPGETTHRGAGESNADYYAWEAPVRAAADGKVVAVVDEFEDSDAGLKKADESTDDYLARVQQQQMALFQHGLKAVAGNLVVVEHANGEYSHYAHLRHGSVVVEPGDVVTRGQLLARLGNTGNSTEPHLHFEVTDGPDPLLSAGLPIRFEGVEILLADSPRPLETGDVVQAK